jgi:hypothetical protein
MPSSNEPGMDYPNLTDEKHLTAGHNSNRM